MKLDYDMIIEGFRENLKLEMSERLEAMRFDIINERTPDSLVIGEDDEPDASTD